MTGQIISSALIGATVLFVFTLLRAAGNRPAKRDPKTGDLVLQCSPLLWQLMAAIAVGGPLAMAGLAFVIPFQNQAQVFVPVGLGAFFLLLGGLMSYWALRRRTRVGPAGLTSEYMFAGPRFLAWRDVTKVSFSSGQEFWLHGPKGKAMLHVWFRGVKEAVPLLEQHLPEEVRRKHQGTIDRFAAAVGA